MADGGVGGANGDGDGRPCIRCPLITVSDLPSATPAGKNKHNNNTFINAGHL